MSSGRPFDVGVPGQVEQVFDRGLQPVDRREHVRERRSRVRVGREQRALDLDPQPGDRRAELVRRVGAERAFAADQVARAGRRSCSAPCRAGPARRSPSVRCAPRSPRRRGAARASTSSSIGRVSRRACHHASSAATMTAPSAIERHDEPRVASAVHDDADGPARTKRADHLRVAVDRHGDDDAAVDPGVRGVAVERLRTVASARSGPSPPTRRPLAVVDDEPGLAVVADVDRVHRPGDRTC